MTLKMEWQRGIGGPEGWLHWLLCSRCKRETTGEVLGDTRNDPEALAILARWMTEEGWRRVGRMDYCARCIKETQ